MAIFYLLILLKLGRTLATRAVFHFKYLYLQCDPLLANVCVRNRFRGKGHHFVALSLILFALFYGNVGFYKHSCEEPLNSLEQLYTSPYIFTHQMVPHVAWEPLDMGFILDTIGVFGILLVFLFNPDIQESYQISMDNQLKMIYFGKQAIGLEESIQILLYRKRIKNFMWSMTSFTDLIVTAIFELSFLFGNDQNVFTWFTLSFWFWLFPLYILYIYYCKFAVSVSLSHSNSSLGFYGTALYVTLASVYIEIVQKSYVQKLVEVNRSVKLTQRRSMLVLLQKRYIQINREIANLCGIIKAYSGHCSPILSVIFPMLVMIQSYLIFAAIYPRNFTPMLKQLFLFAVLMINVNVFFLIAMCARVAKDAKKLTAQNRIYYLNLYVKKQALGYYCDKLKVSYS